LKSDEPVRAPASPIDNTGEVRDVDSMPTVGRCEGCGAEVDLIGESGARVLNPAELQAFLDAHQACRARVKADQPFFALYARAS
jgi:hypothetical protein